jgi:hypothetical protein
MGEIKKFGEVDASHVERMLEGGFEGDVDSLIEQNERSLEQLEAARSLWIGNLQALESKIPHDDVLEDDKTQSFHVWRNAWAGRLMELDALQEELEQAREQLSFVKQEQAD